MPTRAQNEDAMNLWLAAPAALALIATPAWAQDPHAGHSGHEMAPAEQPQPNAQATQGEHAGHDMQPHEGRTDYLMEDAPDPAMMRLHVQSALGPYSIRRDASGT